MQPNTATSFRVEYGDEEDHEHVDAHEEEEHQSHDYEQDDPTQEQPIDVDACEPASGIREPETSAKRARTPSPAADSEQQRQDEGDLIAGLFVRDIGTGQILKRRCLGENEPFAGSEVSTAVGCLEESDRRSMAVLVRALLQKAES